MDKRTLRQLIIGLEEARGDVLKEAGVLDWAREKWREHRDPQYKSLKTDLKQKQDEISQQAKAVTHKIQEAQKRQKNLDFEGAAQSTREVQELAKEMLPKAEEAEEKTDEIGERVRGRQYYSAKERRDSRVRQEILQASPPYVVDLAREVAKPGNDIPVQTTHLRDLPFDMKNVPMENFLRATRAAIFTRSMQIGRDLDSLQNQLDRHGPELMKNFEEAIRNGKIQWYDVADVSKEVPNRPVGQMRVIVSVPEILLPGDTPDEDIYLHPNQVMLTELVNRKVLQLYGIQSMLMTGYQEPAVPRETTPEKETEEPEEGPVIANRFWKLRKLGAEELMKEREQEGPLVKAVKRALLREKLPTSRILVSVAEDIPFEYRVRYAQVLSTALRVELDAECSIHNDREKIEVEADLSGSQDLAKQAVAAISAGVTEAFTLSSGVKVGTHVYPGIKSKYALIEPDVVETSFRKIATQIWSR